VSDVQVVAVGTPGLGNQAYLVGHGTAAVAIDVPRDGWRIAEVAERHGWRVTHALETHVHNDYLSGALELRAAHGTELVAPARGGYEFPVRGADEGFELDLGGGGLVALATPGHTPEHLAWELRDADGAPRAVFTGGSLLIGGVGRTDLLGRARTPELTAAQFRTLRRLAALPDAVAVHPTHGAGSFCVAGEADGPSSATIGALRRFNAAFAAADLAAFDRELAAGRTLYPTYYRRMAPRNRRGPRILGGPQQPRPLTVGAVREARSAGTWLIDVRDRWAFAERHVSGSWNVELGDSLSAYVGWLLPYDAPVCLVVDDPVQETEAVDELRQIGFDHVIGHLHGGLDAWTASGGETGSYATAGWEELRAWAAGEGGRAERILDVRQPYEWADGVIPGSRQVFVADLPDAVRTLERDGPWLVACRTGVRATIAASVLAAAGIDARPVVDGGVPALPPEELRPPG
jgi:glyoxylase-like metal-dependent hydrolase (beta-lactamase superfamily II)/rhodanese-related sulfurtransferase